MTVVTMGYGTLPSFEVKDGIKIYRVPCLRSKKEICYPFEMLSYVISTKRFLSKHLAMMWICSFGLLGLNTNQKV